MPIYEYMCNSCKQKTELLQKISDPDHVDCPMCGNPHLKRQLTAPYFRLSGSGWYETDFKQDNQKNVLHEQNAEDKSKTSPEKKSKDESITNKKESKTDGKKTDNAKSTKTSDKKQKPVTNP